MTLPLLKVEDPTLQFNFDEIAKKFLDTGGRQLGVRFGSSSVTFTAAATTAQKTIAHGLGKTPVAVYAFQATPLLEFTHLYESAAADATNIYITGRQLTGTVVTNTQNIYWLVIG